MNELRRTMWVKTERWVWSAALWTGLLLLYASRTSLPFCVAVMAGELGWDKRISVS